MHDQPGGTPQKLNHEVRDVAISPIVEFGVALAIFAVVVLGGLWALYRHLDRREATRTESAYPLAAGNVGRRPTGPQLEGIDPRQELERWRQRKPKQSAGAQTDAALIDAAMKTVARTLKARTNAPASGEIPRDTNSGRGPAARR